MGRVPARRPTRAADHTRLHTRDGTNGGENLKIYRGRANFTRVTKITEERIVEQPEDYWTFVPEGKDDVQTILELVKDVLNMEP